MASKAKKWLWLSAAACAGGSGLVAWFAGASNDEAQGVILSKESIARMKLDQEAQSPFWSRLSKASSEQTGQTLQTSANMFATGSALPQMPQLGNPTGTMIVKLKESECTWDAIPLIGRNFYRDALNATTLDERMDGLRQAISVLTGDQLTPEKMQQAADTLGIKKDDLVKTLRDTAIAYFASRKTPNLPSSYDNMQYWNSMRLALPLAGLDKDGNSTETLSLSATGYSKTTIVFNRNRMLPTTLSEISPEIIVRMQAAVQTALDEKRIYPSGHPRLREVWSKQFDAMPTEELRAFSDKLSTANYSRDWGNLIDFMHNIGMTDDMIEELNETENIVDDAITTRLTDQAKSGLSCPAPGK